MECRNAGLNNCERNARLGITCGGSRGSMGQNENIENAVRMPELPLDAKTASMIDICPGTRRNAMPVVSNNPGHQPQTCKTMKKYVPPLTG